MDGTPALLDGAVFKARTIRGFLLLIAPSQSPLVLIFWDFQGSFLRKIFSPNDKGTGIFGDYPS